MRAPMRLSFLRHRVLRAVLTGAAALTCSGCQLGNSNQPPNTPTSKTLTVSTSTMDFGNVLMGSNKTLGGSLTANTTVTVSSASWNGPGFALSGITFPVTVAAGQKVPFSVTFSPQGGGVSSGTASFISDGSNSPTSVSLSGTGLHNVVLGWMPSSSAVVGYNVYRGTQSGGPYSKLNSSLQSATSYTDSTVQAGHTYYYVTTAVDTTSTESTSSNEVATSVPTP